MNNHEIPGKDQPEGFRLPHWLTPIFMTVLFLLAHVIAPWGLSMLSTRYGWSGRRPGVWNLLALIPVIAGISGAVWMMVLHFRSTPSSFLEFRPTDKVILRGPYAYSRNPMFLFELVFWFGWAFFYGSLPAFIGFLIWLALFNWVSIPWEERDLEKRFGEDYRVYKATVPRWFGLIRR
jgi:protein-S-isoprenylcysteine O-methyltransferase Ste14